MSLNIPRVKLVLKPTPLYKMVNLSTDLGVNLYIKRDDLSLLSFGGNKLRKLEYTLADAINKGCDTIVTTGSLTSNHAMLTAMAAKKLGLNVVLVLRSREPQFSRKVKGNLLIEHLLKARVEVFDVGKEDVNIAMKEVVESLKREGKKPYVLPLGGASPLGLLGYYDFVYEVLEQSKNMKIDFDYIVFATGSGGTQAGILLGVKKLKLKTRVIGVSDGTLAKYLKEKIYTLANTSSKKYNIGVKVDYNDIIVDERASFGGYGKFTRELIETISYVVKREGILLDPLYTGKA
ncbi:MAG TPA: pyridoxal-phosphate dependent enzyme, partial [Thermoproteales archaeon]|nr:pyridoxal-phosphate dependent enzyme [Thermoproteales archaeon]